MRPENFALIEMPPLNLPEKGILKIKCLINGCGNRQIKRRDEQPRNDGVAGAALMAGEFLSPWHRRLCQNGNFSPFAKS